MPRLFPDDHSRITIQGQLRSVTDYLFAGLPGTAVVSPLKYERVKNESKRNVAQQEAHWQGGLRRYLATLSCGVGVTNPTDSSGQTAVLTCDLQSVTTFKRSQKRCFSNGIVIALKSVHAARIATGGQIYPSYLVPASVSWHRSDSARASQHCPRYSRANTPTNLRLSHRRAVDGTGTYYIIQLFGCLVCS